ncbi:MAG: hypothetical protein GY870_11835 [archaeon]|nr:hypothetical protein [archaeon]
MTILHEIADSRRRDLPTIQQVIRDFNDSDIDRKNRTKLSEAFRSIHSMGIISELKPGSPSKGKLLKSVESNSSNINPMDVTIGGINEKIDSMIRGGALAISVLTEPRRFYASYGNLKEVAKITPPHIPILLKDFIIDESQLILGKKCGASNALLIASICDPLVMANKMIKNGLEPLIEIHDEEDLYKIKSLKKINFQFVIGINNRNLHDLSTSFTPTFNLAPKIQEIFGKEQPIITESGIFKRRDMIELGRSGVKAALVGTSIMQSNIFEKVRELLGNKPPYIKICGITEKIAFQFLKDPIIDAIGFIVEVDSSVRNLKLKEANDLFRSSPKNLLRTMVTKGKSIEDLLKLIMSIQPDLIQNHFKDPNSDIRKIPVELIPKFIIPIRTAKLGLEKSVEIINKLPKSIFGILLDSSEGSGKLINQEMAKKIVELCPQYKIIIAGGITPENVGNIYNEIKPFGLDVCSSLEIMGGVKDPKKIKLFLEEIKKILKNEEN